MSKLKLFGFTAEEQQLLQNKVKAEQWEEGQVEELSEPRPDSEVWVVCVTAAEEFLNAAFRLPHGRRPKAVLWVPHGFHPRPLADWWEGFHAQLRDSEEDLSFLERVSRCARVVEWGERVEDIPAGWVAELTGSPRLYRVDALPFNEEEKQHLKKCVDCREEASERIHWRAEMRWTMLCPEVSEIAEWLESEEENRRLEAHVSTCGLCRETVKRQAWLWEGAGLVTAEQVNAKLAAVGIAEPVVKPGVADAWLAAALDLQQAQAQTAGALAALIAAVLCRHTALRPALRTPGPPAEETGVSMEDLNAYLTAGEPVTLLGKEQWLHLMVEGDAVLLWAGRSPADRFEQFRVELRRGKEVVVAVEAEDGVARLTPEHFQTANIQQADRLVIIA